MSVIEEGFSELFKRAGTAMLRIKWTFSTGVSRLELYIRLLQSQMEVSSINSRNFVVERIAGNNIGKSTIILLTEDSLHATTFAKKCIIFTVILSNLAISTNKVN